MNIYEASKKALQEKKMHERKSNCKGKSKSGDSRDMYINEIRWKPPGRRMATNNERATFRILGDYGIN